MPITVNESGVLHELTDVTVNESGTLYALDTVHANENGVLYEIHSSLPKSLTWTCDTSKDSTAKLNSVSADGMTVNYTSANSAWSVATDAIYSNNINLPAGAVISAVFSNISGTGNSKSYGMLVEKNGNILGGGAADQNGWSYTVTATGTYRLALRAHSVVGSQSGVTYSPCTVTVKISITK